MNNNNKYYDISKILSYNKIWNFVVGSRGSGKTTSALRLCINKFLKNKEKFYYIRRYETEIDEIISKDFFKDMVNFFPDVEFSVKNRICYINGEEAGYINFLTKAAGMKSINLQDVSIILFDEFLPDDRRFLGGNKNYHYEPMACLRLYQTVARGKDRPIRENVKFLFLANSVSIINPYFSFFGIDKMIYPNTKFLKGNGWVLELNKNEFISEEIKKSQFGELIKGTPYEEYSLNNKFIFDSDEFIEKMTGKQTYFCTIVYDGLEYGVYQNKNNDIIYISEKVNDNFPIIYSFTNSDHKPNYLLLRNTNSDERVKMLKFCYDLGLVRFETQKCKVSFLSCMSYI